MVKATPRGELHPLSFLVEVIDRSAAGGVDAAQRGAEEKEQIAVAGFDDRRLVARPHAAAAVLVPDHDAALAAGPVFALVVRIEHKRIVGFRIVGVALDGPEFPVEGPPGAGSVVEALVSRTAAESDRHEQPAGAGLEEDGAGAGFVRGRRNATGRHLPRSSPRFAVVLRSKEAVIRSGTAQLAGCESDGKFHGHGELSRLGPRLAAVLGKGHLPGPDHHQPPVAGLQRRKDISRGAVISSPTSRFLMPTAAGAGARDLQISFGAEVWARILSSSTKSHKRINTSRQNRFIAETSVYRVVERSRRVEYNFNSFKALSAAVRLIEHQQPWNPHPDGIRLFGNVDARADGCPTPRANGSGYADKELHSPPWQTRRKQSRRQPTKGAEFGGRSWQGRSHC